MINNMVSCRACEKELHISANRCPHCGASQRTKRYKSKVATGVLAILLGGLGVHRFYLGQWWGIFYLLLFWTMIPGIIAMIEGIVILVSNSEKWDNKYNEGMAGEGESSAGIIIAAIAGVFVFISIIGILAAIAIPAYQDYTIRAKVAQAMSSSTAVKQSVEQYTASNKSWPSSNKDLALSETINDNNIDTLNVSDGGIITIRFSESAGGQIATKTIVLTPSIDSNKIVWSCSEGTLDQRYRLSQCRE